jgi:dihydrofolate reductase
MYRGSKVTQILAVSKDGFIGDKNTIPWKCKVDMVHFASNTKGKVCIMGRKTFESINPPLKHRIVIVVSKDATIADRLKHLTDYTHASTVEEALDLANAIALSREIMIVGGKMIYEETMQYADRVLLSTIDVELKTADTKMDWVIPDNVEIVPFEFQVDP